MIATFVLLQPGWLAAGFVAAVAASVLLRRRPPRVDAATHVPLGRAVRHGGRALALGAGAALLAAWLVHEDTLVAHVLIGALALAALVWLTIESYRRRPRSVGALTAALLVAIRVVAWVAVVLMVGRPIWRWTVVEWRKPLLVALLDQSNSMSIADRTDADAPAPTRAERANKAIALARSWVARLNEMYDVRVLGLRVGTEPPEGWQIAPRDMLSGVADALRHSGQLRSEDQNPPYAVLLISDGAENVAEAPDVRRAARVLAEQKTALITCGVGPAPGRSPTVDLQPLALPPRIGLRDHLRVHAAARVQGCLRQTVLLELLWDDEVVAEEPTQIVAESQRLTSDFEVAPNTPGVHRLTLRVTLPEVLGAAVYEMSSVLEVTEDRIRVLLLEGAPRTEAAFVLRAWAGDPRLETTPKFLPRNPGRIDSRFTTGAEAWEEYDVVVLGNVPKWRLSSRTLKALADAVTTRGVGLLLAGGPDFYNEGDYDQTTLGDLCPVRFVLEIPPVGYRPRLLPSATGWDHPVFRGTTAHAAQSRAGRPASPMAPPSLPQVRAVWESLPTLGGAARLGQPNPVAAVLAENEQGQPLLVAQEVGRGRCVAAAWNSTWPWALGSDEGAALHRQFWRQLVVWLAHRRPRAWVLADATTYPRAALSAGRRPVLIRAGVTGLAALDSSIDPTELSARLTLRPPAQPQPAPPTPQSRPVATEMATQIEAGAPGEVVIPLRRAGREWVAELTTHVHGELLARVGKYELEFTLASSFAGGMPEASTTAALALLEEELTARTQFTISETDLELRPPTSNLMLLRQVAELTAEHGGRYAEIEQLPELLRDLATTDRRRRIEATVQYDVTQRKPWLPFTVLVGALALEWALRKRRGMV